MSTKTVKMLYAAGATPTQFVSQLANSYTPDSTGAIYVAPNDILSALAAGWIFWNAAFRNPTVTTPAAASAALLVASVAASNGALTIAAQPDVLRQAQFVVGAGTGAITGGTLSLVYYANDGTTQTDTFNLATAASGTTTLTSSKGVLFLSSATIAGLTQAGTGAFIKGGTNATLALPVDPGFANFTVLRENVDGSNETIGTVTASGALIAPTTAPNGTHSYSFGYTYSTAE